MRHIGQSPIQSEQHLRRPPAGGSTTTPAAPVGATAPAGPAPVRLPVAAHLEVTYVPRIPVATCPTRLTR